MTTSRGAAARGERLDLVPTTQPEASGHFDYNQNRSVRTSVRKGLKKKFSKINGFCFKMGARWGCGHFVYILRELEVSAQNGWFLCGRMARRTVLGSADAQFAPPVRAVAVLHMWRDRSGGPGVD
jgi:hypothetical protein